MSINFAEIYDVKAVVCGVLMLESDGEFLDSKKSSGCFTKPPQSCEITEQSDVFCRHNTKRR